MADKPPRYYDELPSLLDADDPTPLEPLARRWEWVDRLILAIFLVMLCFFVVEQMVFSPWILE